MGTSKLSYHMRGKTTWTKINESLQDIVHGFSKNCSTWTDNYMSKLD